MATRIVLASDNLMRAATFYKRLSILRLVISMNPTAKYVHSQPRHVDGTVTSRQARKDFSAYCIQPGNRHSHPPPPPPPPSPPPSSWHQWIFRIIATVILPFFSKKWNNLLKFKDEVDTVVEETEKIVEYVEEVAETLDKVAKDVADHLPEGGKWKNAAVFVEDVAEEIAREAHLVEDFIHEVEEVEEKVELLVELAGDQTTN